MALCRKIVWLSSALFGLSCTHAPATPAPAPGSAPVASAGRQPGAPGQAGGPPRRVPPSRDSLARLRAVYVAQIMTKIAGREDQPAEKVFENIQVLKGITAAQLVHKMDKEYGEALSWSCTNCHRFAPQGNFASDTSADKKRARFMQTMTNDLNLVQLPKLYPKQTPVVSCATCHRGYNEPPPVDYLAPARGQPGAPVPPPPPPGRGGSGG